MHCRVCRDCEKYCFFRQICSFPGIPVFLKALKRLGGIHCIYKGRVYLPKFRDSVSFGTSQGIWNSHMKLAGVTLDVLEISALWQLEIG